jgi:beta-glucosidase/6-phospho-beta-glucosidase/beta-galactosidase
MKPIAAGVLLAGLLWLAACQSQSADDDVTEAPDADDDNDDDAGDAALLPLTFPPGFLFGTATAGFQVEMGCPTLPRAACADPHTDWYQYMVSPETRSLLRTFIKGEDPAVVGPGHWELFESDFDLAVNELAGNAFRLGIEWSRIFPESTVGVEGLDDLRAVANPDALAHYHAVFDALAERGLTPLVTLHHYTLPDWVHDGVGCTLDLDDCSPRGWLEPELVVPEIAKFAGFVAAEFGADVDLWTTLNEPFAVLFTGFLLPTPTRSNPPARIFDAESFRTAYLSMIEAHARMFDAVHANDTVDADGDGDPARVGLVYAMSPAKPADPTNPLDVQAAENVFYLWNLAFLNAVAAGLVDGELDGAGEYRADFDGRMDFIGVNYYARIQVEGLPFSILPWITPLATINPLTIRFDEIYPRGVIEMATEVRERYGLPIYVTENNAGVVPQGDMATEIRSLVETLSWIAAGIADGLEIGGYFYWSLLDNYEWNQGMDGTYGLYAIDPHDPAKTRVPRETVAIYRRIAEAGGIPASLAALFPLPGN